MKERFFLALGILALVALAVVIAYRSWPVKTRQNNPSAQSSASAPPAGACAPNSASCAGNPKLCMEQKKNNTCSN